MGGRQSIFDGISKDDIVLAFFPCTRFEAKIPLAFRGEMYQQKNWDDSRKLDYAMQLHEELHRNYMLISKLVSVAIKKGIQLVIENPYTQPHYLTEFWALKPKVIDKDRRENGDHFKKPTQFWFIGFEPKHNLVFEPIDYVQTKIISRVKGADRQKQRSEIHPQYASRFIRQYILDESEVNNEQK